MTDNHEDEAAQAFVEIIRAGAGGTVSDDPAEPDEPPGPRAPRPDLSQGSSSASSRVDTYAAARVRLAEALRQGAYGGSGNWRPVA